MSTVALIVATNKRGVIGHRGRIPWHCPADLDFFKRATMGAACLWGRVTWEGLPPLPGRRHHVISRSRDPKIPGVGWHASLADALAATQHEERVLVCGGAEIYRAALDADVVDVILWSEIDDDSEGDRFFRPDLDPDQWRWRELELSGGVTVQSIVRVRVER